MKKIRLGTGFTIFILFFGIATLDAFQSHDWSNIVFWVAIGSVFLLLDNLNKA